MFLPKMPERGGPKAEVTSGCEKEWQFTHKPSEDPPGMSGKAVFEFKRRSSTLTVTSAPSSVVNQMVLPICCMPRIRCPICICSIDWIWLFTRCQCRGTWDIGSAWKFHSPAWERTDAPGVELPRPDARGGMAFSRVGDKYNDWSGWIPEIPWVPEATERQSNSS